MKIVIIPSADLLYNSGSVIYAKILFEYLLNEGHDVCMIGACIPNDIDARYKEKIKVKKNLLSHPIVDDRIIDNMQYFKMGSDILEALIEINKEWGKIDIINAHYASINSYAAVLFGEFVKTSIIVSSFGRDINIGYDSCDLMKKMIEYSYKKADKIIVPDLMIKKKILKSFSSINADKIENCPMPVDEKIYLKGTLIKCKSDNIIISTINSCFKSDKGIDCIILAFSKVVKKFPKCKLFIAGQDDNEEKNNYLRLKKLIEQLHMEKKVFFTNFLSRINVGRLLDITDIFIDARINGNFSSVLIEAEFKHKPIIASNNEMSKRIIEDGKNGVLFKNGNVNDLEQKIVKLLVNTKWKERLIDGTKLWCANEGKEYEVDICMKKMIEIFKKIVKQSV